ncbi:MAG: Flp pilus assembly complex ATPase component TadA [Bacilli bacterium]|nr:Flp pilus assembly complex ATPase component TadA [Bacilli bacterium]
MLKTFDFEKMPIVEIVNEILVDSSKRGASDIHFDPQENFMKVRIRIDGELHDYCEVPNAVKKNLTTRVKIISGMNITESRLPQDGAIKATLQDIDLDLRVSVLPVSNGEKIVIRILDYTKSLSGLEQLDFSEDNFKKVLYMIGVPNGIILVTGATGSGKSTTVYSILQRLNRVDTNLITVEDPIEMDIEGINQVQVNAEIGLTFASALRSILRQDPNIIMIGEIRDTETAKIAVRASITGHLVLSTIHTNNSLNTIERLLDMDVERYLLSSALTGIISQKLARRLCPKCKALRKTNEYEKKLFKTVLNKDIDEVYSAVGCEECGNGYSGRIAIHEVLVINQQIRDALSSGMKKEDLRTLVYSSDIHSLLQDSLEKVIAGHSTVEEMLKLIELENDDKLAGELDLKKALEFSEIANEAEHHEEATSQVTEVTGDALATTFETETPESAAPIAPAQVEPTPVAEPVAAPVQTPEVTSTPVAPATPVVNEVVTPQAPVMPAEANVTLEQPVITPVEVPTVNPTVVPTVTPAENPNAGIPEIVS